MDTKAYTDLKGRHQAEFNEFSEEWCFFAFSDEQFREGMEKIGPKMAEGEKVVRMATGMFCPKSKVGDLMEIAGRQRRELRGAMQSPEFARAAFFYEMANHEYHINWQADWDVCACFTSKEPSYDEDGTFVTYLSADGFGDEVIRAYREARREFYRMADEEGWF